MDTLQTKDGRSQDEQDEDEETRREFIDRLEEWYTTYNAVLRPLLEVATLEVTSDMT